MIKVYCDKCGKVIEPLPFFRKDWRKLHLLSEGEEIRMDLCDACLYKVLDFVKRGAPDDA